MKEPDKSRIREHLVSPKTEVRKKALAELKKLPAESALAVLVSALGEKNGDVQADLTKAFLGYRDSALPHLVTALTSAQWRTRKAASQVIAALGDGALARFLELIPKNEDDVDYWMVQTLSLMGGEATPYLIKAFSHANRKVRLAAVRAAANTKDPRIVLPLLRILEEKNWPLRKAAFDSLQRVHHLAPQAVDDALRTAAAEAKFWVIQLAAERRDVTLLPTFSAIIEHDPEESKLEALRAIAMIESREAQKVLVGYLAHKSWIVRKTAADCIWEQGLGVSDELLASISAPNVDARYWSVKLLGQSNEPRVFPQLLECLHDTQASVRAAACQALGALADKRALAPLMALLNDGAEEVRTAALLAISQIGEKDAGADKPSIPTHLRPENQQACRHCGKKVGINFTFCPFCLGHLKAACRKCGRAMEPGWKGCPDCGEPA
ncbi:MAG: hypothetical protein GX442_00540 [Candidatus Riflebacteria bacterium]|nr:hypothetical protein [Candidatus Riflebacteria bacterium]